MSQEESNVRKFSVVPKQAGRRGDDADLCPVCFGSGMEIVPGQGARPCQCRITKLKENSLDRLNIPKRYTDCHFHNYQAETPSQQRAFKMASELSLKYPAVDRGLVLMGTVGVGKTHLAVSILKSLSEKGISSYFCEFGSLLKEIQDSYNPVSQNSELLLLAPVFESEVLVLDELGASKPTDWVRDTLSYIINTRYNDKKLTIFTTNYLDKRYHNEEILPERIGVRLRSRLHEMCRTVTIVGDDYRKNFDRSAAPKKTVNRE
jgi:DNA replication protein DnaC